MVSRTRNRQPVRPLTEEEIHRVAPSISAHIKHSSRSERYTYIPTSGVLQGLRREGFEPLMVAQAQVRDEGKREHAKHMIRLGHASQISEGGSERNLSFDSHDGTSSYQMLAGMFRFVCCNGMVCDNTLSDVRVPRTSNVVDQVIQGAFDALDGFTRIVDERDSMKATPLKQGEQTVFARAALEFR